MFALFSDKRPFPCPLCPKTFSRLSALQIHRSSIHDGLKSWLCPECGGAFKSHSALIDHGKRVHQRLKPHHCQDCGKDFFSSKDLVEHARMHTGEKPFKCEVFFMP